MAEAWSVIVHGGAKFIRPERREANRAGCLEAVEAASAILREGGPAIAATEAAIRVLEDNPVFNAGYGSVLNRDGQVEMDAAIMDGADLAVGAIAAVQGVRNPISVAARLMLDGAVFLVGEGARRFAEEEGLALCDPAAMIGPPNSTDEGSDTVGCVALDSRGSLAAGASTGGLGGVRPGRVGDAPLPGCGLYAENGLGAVAFSGDGESIIRLALAGRLMNDLRDLPPHDAGWRAIAQMARVGGEAGCIALTPSGLQGFAHNSEHFAVAMASAARPPTAFLHQSEFAHG